EAQTKDIDNLDTEAQDTDNDTQQLNNNDTPSPHLLNVTADHPLYIENQGWLNAENLSVGDRLRRADGGMARVLAIERIVLDDAQLVYNFTVKGPHTYFVLEVGVLVHNCLSKGDQHRLQELKEEKAFYGIDTRPETLIEIENIEAVKNGNFPLPATSYNQRKLQKLQEQQAKYGISASPELLIEIEDIEAVMGKKSPLPATSYNQRKLQKLQEQQAKHGLNTPPEVLIEIEDILDSKGLPDQITNNHIIQYHHRRLQKLQEQQAYMNTNTPVHVITEIEDIKSTLHNLNDVELPQDLPQNLAILKIESAKRGINSPPHIFMQIEDLEAKSGWR
ncbi:MAG: hypothetical protein GY797_28125, partial [Deltaproteobacteria bacterium]|nr:hypothetical protein [Deltaproteobacteria bacterium]